MSQTITLELPDRFLLPLQRTAKAVNSPIETLLLKALQNSLPPLDGLPDDILNELTSLETLGNDELLQTLRQTVPIKLQTQISELLIKNNELQLTDAENSTLADLQKQADMVMLRKARAAVLLRFRGHRLPTLAELESSK
jgi:hypothetical protein